MAILFTHIKQLVNTREGREAVRGKDLAELPVIEDAFLLVEDDTIVQFGKMHDLELMIPQMPRDVFDLSGRLVLPSWCDSHTHLVFAGSRETEFVDKIEGLSYAEIAKRGGGILNSAAKLQEISEDELFRISKERLKMVQGLGTGAIEIKSGYGLTLESEIKMLRVIRRLKKETGMLIRSTFLGAHTFPLQYRENQEGYINLLIGEMLPKISEEGLADYIDVFCEKGFFSPEQTTRICKAGARYGLKPKLHVNQLNSIGGIEAGIGLNAVSMDHLETLNGDEIKLLGKWEGISTLLPTAAFFLRMAYQPARDLINNDAAVALASDYNPGSSPSGNMNFVVALSCIQMKMLPKEAVNAATINGAVAMGVEKEVGSIAIGKKANLIITNNVPSLEFLPYSFAHNHIDKVMLNGEWIEK